MDCTSLCRAALAAGLLATWGCEPGSRTTSDAFTAGDLSNADTGGDSGTGTGGTVIVPGGPMDPSAVAKASVVLGSCVGEGLSGFSQSLYTDLNRTRSYVKPVITCLAGTTNGCQSYVNCSGYQVSGTGCTTGEETLCVGNRLQYCYGPGQGFSTDCGKLGATCGETAAGEVVCDDGSYGPVCDWQTYEASCVGGRPATCGFDVVDYGPTCSDYGLTCAAEGSTATCKGSGAACGQGDIFTSGGTVDLGEGIACQNGQLEVCVGGATAKVACSSLGFGFTCQDVDGEVFCGLASECSPTQTASTCEGTSLTMCNAGRLETFDCVLLGFTGCDAEQGVCTPSLQGSFGP